MPWETNFGLYTLAAGCVFDTPPQPGNATRSTRSARATASGVPTTSAAACRRTRILRLKLTAAASIHWSIDGWRTSYDTPTQDSGFGIPFVDLATTELTVGNPVVFTFYWPAADRWEGGDYPLIIE